MVPPDACRAPEKSPVVSNISGFSFLPPGRGEVASAKVAVARGALKFRSGEIAAQIRDFPPNATPSGFSNIVSPFISFRTGSCLLCGGAVARRSRATAAWDAWKGRGFGVSGVVGLKGQGVGDHGAKTCKGKVSFSHKNLCFCGVKPRTFF